MMIGSISLKTKKRLAFGIWFVLRIAFFSKKNRNNSVAMINGTAPCILTGTDANANVKLNMKAMY